MKSEQDKAIRQQLVKTLRGGNAFDTFDEIIGQIPEDARFFVPNSQGRSAWEIVEHMGRALTDIDGYVDNADGSYKAMSWPDDYWPIPCDVVDPGEWDRSVAGFRSALARMEALILDENRDLTAPFPWGESQTLLHEALLAIEHNAHHLGQLVELTTALQA